MEGLYYPYSENKGADQLRGYREADLRLCFPICKKPVFSRRGSYNINKSSRYLLNPLLMEVHVKIPKYADRLNCNYKILDLSTKTMITKNKAKYR